MVGKGGGKSETKTGMLGRKSTMSQVPRQQIPWMMFAQQRQSLTLLDYKDEGQSREDLPGQSGKE